MAGLDQQGQTAAPFHEKVGRQEHTGSGDFIQRRQYINKRTYHTLPGRDLAKRWRQSQHVCP